MSGAAGRRPSLRLDPTAWAALSMVVLGLVGPSWGPALVPARARFHLDLLVAGTLFLIFGACRTLGAALTAVLSDRLSQRAAAAAYGVVLVGALLAVALAPSWGVVLCGAAGIGFAFGTIGTEANALAAANASGRGRAITFVNAAWAVGAVFGPLAVGVLLKVRLGWRLAFAIWAALAVGPLAGLTAASAPRARRTVRSPVPADPRLLALAAMAFVYNGVGWTVSGWAASYLVARFGASVLTGALGSAVFYACIAAGQLGAAAFTGRLTPGRRLWWLSLATTAALLGLALAPVSVLAVGAFGTVGLALGGIYPNLVDYAASLRPDRPGAMAGVVATGGAIGVGLVPFGAGALGHVAGIGSMAWLLLGLAVPLLVLAYALRVEPEGARMRFPGEPS